MLNILQGSALKRLRCCVAFNDDCYYKFNIEYGRLNILRIDELLVKLRQKLNGFFDSHAVTNGPFSSLIETS